MKDEELIENVIGLKEEEEEDKEEEEKKKKKRKKKNRRRREEKEEGNIRKGKSLSSLYDAIKQGEKDEFKMKEQKFNKLLTALINEMGKDESDSENNLINIEPISDYVKKKKEEWEKNKNSESFSMEEFAKSISILPDFNYEFLLKEINNNFDNFISYYKIFQFSLTASQRKVIQNQIKDRCSLPLIKNNFIQESIKEIKDIFIELCNDIIKEEKCFEKDFPEKLKNIFMKNYVYSEGKFISSIPAEFGNIELKMNKLIFEVVDFFYKKPMNQNVTDENEIKLMRKKFQKFKLFKPVFEKFQFFANDEELYKVCNYLFNAINVLFDAQKDKRNDIYFPFIISCCIPFQLEKAKNFLNDLLNVIEQGIIDIDGKDIRGFNINDIKADSEFLFIERNIKVLCKDINWNLNTDNFLDFLQNDNFMLCFRFPKLSEINYLFINDDIHNNYNTLFKNMMKSEIMKEAMNIDKDAKLFQYPFNNDLILNEIEQNCYLVPLPAKNYFGISDRSSFSIYLNCFISSTNFKNTFIDIDYIMKSKCHAIKHIYRIYIHMYKPKIQIKTPEIKLKSLNKNDLTKNKNDYFNNKIKIITHIYNTKNVPMNSIEELDYGDGDILEFALNGSKQDVFFFKNSIFCLSEDSWKLDKKKFVYKYFKTCFDKEFTFKRLTNNIFIGSVIDYFKFRTGQKITNSADTSKSSSKGKNDETYNIDNNYFYLPRASHFNK